jgi:hypothetical protein
MRCESLFSSQSLTSSSSGSLQVPMAYTNTTLQLNGLSISTAYKVFCYCEAGQGASVYGTSLTTVKRDAANLTSLSGLAVYATGDSYTASCRPVNASACNLRGAVAFASQVRCRVL